MSLHAGENVTRQQPTVFCRHRFWTIKYITEHEGVVFWTIKYITEHKGVVSSYED